MYYYAYNNNYSELLTPLINVMGWLVKYVNEIYSQVQETAQGKPLNESHDEKKALPASLVMKI